MKATTFLEEFQAVEAALRDRIDGATLECIKQAIDNGDAITKHAFTIALNRYFGECVEQSKWVDLSKLTTMGVQYPPQKTTIPEELPKPKLSSEAERLTDIYEILNNKPCPKGFDNGAYNGTIRHIGISILSGNYDIAWQCILYIANLFNYDGVCDNECLEIARESNGHVNTGICFCENSSVVLVRCGFKDGLKHGAQVMYFDDGSFRVQHICNFKKNKPIGVSILYDISGNILNINTKHLNVPF